MDGVGDVDVLILYNVIEIGYNFFIQHIIQELYHGEMTIGSELLSPAVVCHFWVNMFVNDGT